MEYVKVESSQIAEVGFGEGYYGPETLGLRFPPTKKQVAAGEDGSEYHYQNVTPRMHQALMAAPSIGSYFGQNIKSRPDLYPFMKVEADPHPAAQSNGNGQTQSSTMKAATDGETPAPVTALAVIDSMADDLLFTPNAVTDAQLAAGRDWYLAEAKKYDIATEKARAEFKRFARPLQKLRTGIEARAKELTGATKRKIAAIDAEKRRLVGIVGGIEDEVLAPLTSWEAEEEARKIRLARTVNYLADRGAAVSLLSVAEIESAIAELEAFDLSTMQEYKIGAESAIIASLKVLKPELARRKEAEAQAKELAQLRAEAAERAEQDRLASVAKGAQEAAIEAERKRVADAAAAEQSAAEARAANAKHRKRVNGEAVAALMACSLTKAEAETVVSAIAGGSIPHVTIAY